MSSILPDKRLPVKTGDGCECLAIKSRPLLANPTAAVEVGTEQFRVRATIVTEEPQRSELYAKIE